LSVQATFVFFTVSNILMRSTLYLLTAFCVFAFASCGKDVSIQTGSTPDNPYGGGNTNGDIVVRVESIDGVDTGYTDYGYDSQNRVLNRKEIDKSNGSAVIGFGRYERDGEGRIVKIAAIDNTVTDTAYATLHYPTAGSFNFDYKVTKFKGSAGITTDSAYITYANNVPVKEEHYLIGPAGGPAVLFLRAEYSYSADGDVNSIKSYSLTTPGGSLVYGGEFKLAYDNKNNPTAFGKDGFAVEGYIMKHNLIKQEIIDPNPANNITVDVTYTYNSKGYPISGTATGGGDTSKVKFYYK
jgi:hypothetical protein